MVALYILGGLIALLFAISRLRVGVHVRFGPELWVWATLGPKKVQLIPKPAPKPQKEKKPKKPKEPKPEAEEKPKKKKGLPLSLDELRELLPAVWESLQRVLHNVGKRIRIDPLYLNVVFGDPDPCETAERYGAACSAMWAVMPRLERLVQLPDPELHFNVDFSAESTKASGEIGVYFRIGDFVAIGCSAIPPLFKWFMGYRKRSRQAPIQAGETVKTTEDRIA